jgi:twitching motility protein PilU
VRSSLAVNLRAIVAQRLIRTQEGNLVVAVEVLLNEALIRELIMKGDGARMREVMANNNAANMMIFDQSIFRLFVEGKIDDKTAISEADVPADMKMRIQQYRLNGKQGMSVDTSRLSL